MDRMRLWPNRGSDAGTEQQIFWMGIRCLFDFKRILDCFWDSNPDDGADPDASRLHHYQFDGRVELVDMQTENDRGYGMIKITYRVFFAMLLVLSANPLVQASPFRIEGKVVSVADGDTITVLDGINQQQKIRLAQIDAPEISHGSKNPGQPFGEKSKQSMADLVFGKIVRAECATADRYGRNVCTVFVDDVDINLEQIKRGMAMVYRHYATDPNYYHAQDSAKINKRGLWIDAAPVEPWTWRHQ